MILKDDMMDLPLDQQLVKRLLVISMVQMMDCLLGLSMSDFLMAAY